VLAKRIAALGMRMLRADPDHLTKRGRVEGGIEACRTEGMGPRRKSVGKQKN